MVKLTDDRISWMVREADRGTFDARYWANHWGVTDSVVDRIAQEVSAP